MLESIDSKELQKLLLYKTGKQSVSEITKEDIENIKSITFSGRLMNGSKSDIDVSAIRIFTGLERVSLSDIQISQELIDYLMSLKTLKGMEFVRCNFRNICFPEDIDDSLKVSIVGCSEIPFAYPKVKEVVISGSNVDFEKIDFSVAESVNMLECNIGNAHSLENFENIRDIRLDGSQLFDGQGEKVKDILVSPNTNYSHQDKLELYDDREIN